MNEKAYKVLVGFTKLNYAEQQEFIQELTKYRQAGIYERSTLQEGFQRKSSVGPKDSVCTCCGR
jgi:hypothetical protein